MVGVIARWIGAVFAALFGYFLILTILVTAGVALTGASQQLYMFAIGSSVFGGVLIGTAIAPLPHRRVALWLFIGLMGLIPLSGSLLSLISGDGTIGWLDLAGTASGLLFAPMIARSAIKGCEAKTAYPLSVTEPPAEKPRPASDRRTSEESEAPPFTHPISSILMAVIAGYFVINAVVVTTCITSGGGCTFLQAFAQPFSAIPAISRPVEFLIATGNPDRAATVAGLYAFGWLTGLIAIAAMITTAVVICGRASAEEKRHAILAIRKRAQERMQYYPREHGSPVLPAGRRGPLGMGSVVIVGLTLACFVYVFWGYYSFGEWHAYSNMVHVRDRDFYLMSIGWSLGLVFSMFVIMGAIGRFVLPDDLPAS